MPIIPYTGSALAPGTPAGSWAPEAGAAVQPNIKLAPRLAHSETPPPTEDPYVEIFEAPTPPNSQYNEIVIRLHDDVEQINLDIEKILDQIPEEIKGKNLSVKLSLERPVSSAFPEIPLGPEQPESEPESESESAAEEDPVAASPKTKFAFALDQLRRPLHPGAHNWVYLGKTPAQPQPPSIETINSELQRTAMQVSVVAEDADAAWLLAEQQRKADEAAGIEPLRTAQSGPPLPLSKPRLWVDVEYEGVQMPNLVRAILPEDFWETNERIVTLQFIKDMDVYRYRSA